MAQRKRKPAPSQSDQEAAEAAATVDERVDRVELIDGKSCLVVLKDGSSFQYHDYELIGEVFAQIDSGV